MSLNWWHRALRGLRRSSPAKLRRRRSFLQVPRLEGLEERTLLSTSIPINASTWTAIGPAPILPFVEPLSGRISGIVTDPSNPNIYYVSAPGGGVWKTIDGGADWTPLTDNIAGLAATQRSLMIGTLATGPKDPITGINALYAGEGDPNNATDSYYGHGVLKSTDGGVTWALLGNNVFEAQSHQQNRAQPDRPEDPLRRGGHPRGPRASRRHRHLEKHRRWDHLDEHHRLHQLHAVVFRPHHGPDQSIDPLCRHRGCGR